MNDPSTFLYCRNLWLSCYGPAQLLPNHYSRIYAEWAKSCVYESTRPVHECDVISVRHPVLMSLLVLLVVVQGAVLAYWYIRDRRQRWTERDAGLLRSEHTH